MYSVFSSTRTKTCWIELLLAGIGTVTVAVADWPSHWAVTNVTPAARPDTLPELDTVATATSDDDHVMVRTRTLPAESRASACSASEPPGAMVPAPGVTTTFATRGGGGGGESFGNVSGGAVVPGLLREQPTATAHITDNQASCLRPLSPIPSPS